MDQQSGLGAFAVKALIAGVVIFAGIGGGIYVGMAYTGMGGFGGISAEDLRNESYVSIGDQFPNYSLTDLSNGNSTTVAQVVADKPTVMIFSSPSCGACDQLAAFWRRKEMADFGDEVRIAVIYNSKEVTPEDYESLLKILPGASVFSTERTVQQVDDGIVATPTLVALEKSGKTVFVQTGFTKELTAQVIKDLL